MFFDLGHKYSVSLFTFSPHCIFNVNLSILPDPPREPVVNESMTVLEGSSLALHCSTQGNPAPTLTWLKDGELVGTITADELSVLEVIEVTPQGDGQYRCLAENEHGRASSSFNITVECECCPPHCRATPECSFKSDKIR